MRDQQRVLENLVTGDQAVTDCETDRIVAIHDCVRRDDAVSEMAERDHIRATRNQLFDRKVQRPEAVGKSPLPRPNGAPPLENRQRVLSGKSGSVRVDLGGSRIIKTTKKRIQT